MEEPRLPPPMPSEGRLGMERGLSKLRSTLGVRWGASDLSGMAQSVGFTIAAFGPLGAGFLRDLSGGWALPTIFFLTVVTHARRVGQKVKDVRLPRNRRAIQRQKVDHARIESEQSLVD